MIDLDGSAIKARVFTPDGDPSGVEINVNSTLLGGQSAPAVAGLTNGNFIVTWTDPTIAGLTGANVLAQIFNASGQAVGLEFVANGGLVGALVGVQTESSVTALEGGGFVVTWTDGLDDGRGLQGQVFSESGIKLGADFTINTETAGAQAASVITGLANGGFVVAWEDASGAIGDASGTAIAMQVFTDAGVKLGGELLVNTSTTNFQTAPAVTALSNGNFVVSWMDSSGTLGDSSDSVKARLFSEDGTALGSEFLVNTETANGQGDVSLAAIADGGFVAVWEDFSGALGDGSGAAIAIQAFDASGNKLGGEARVNTTVVGSQLNPTVAVLADGQIVVSWETPGANGSVIVSQHLTLDNAPDSIAIDTATVLENAANGTLVGTVSADDDDGDAITYSLTDNAAGRFAINATTGAITVADGSQLNFESAASHQITVRATDSLGLFTDQALVITIGNVDESPVLNGTPGDDVLTAPSGDTTTINGGDGNDTLTGNSGNDALNGGEGDDVLSGMGGNDTLNGNNGNDQLNGGDDDDFLYGGAGVDELNGQGGNDLLDGGTDADTLRGGAGDDIYVVDNVGDVVEELPDQGNDTIRTTIDYTLDEDQSIERLIALSDGGLALTGNSLANRIDGAAGDDTLAGLDGDDSLFGNAGADTLEGGNGNDLLDGGTDAEVMRGGAGDDVYVVDNVGDVVEELPGQGNDTIRTTIDYTLDEDQSIEQLIALSDAGLALTGNSLANRIDGAAGDDTLAGLDGDDTLSGNAGADTLEGGNGNDLLDGGTDADVMRGGAGDDVYVVDNVGDVVEELPGQGNDTIDTTIDYTLDDDQSIERLTALSDAGLALTGNSLANRIDGAAGDDTLVGLDGADTLLGNAGVDTLEGGNGNDRLDGGGGADVMRGGAGDDIYVVDDAGDVVEELPGQGNDMIQSAIDYTLSDGQSIERLLAASDSGLTLTGNQFANRIDGAAGDDTLVGLDGDDTLSGNAGVDTLEGGNGTDRLNGGAGADVMRGGAGDDIYYVDNAGDVVDEAPNSGNDTILSTVDYTLAEGLSIERLAAGSAASVSLTGNSSSNRIDGGAGDDIIHGLAGADLLNGGAGADTIYGEEDVDRLSGGIGDDILDGGDGNDQLDGGAGVDVMRGGDGNDSYYVDDAGDVVEEGANGGIDTIYASADYTLDEGVHVENLRSHVNTAISLTGNSFANLIYGANGDDTISGLGDDDVLNGRGGADAIDGGTGADRIYGEEGADTLMGGDGTDRIYGGNANDHLFGGDGEDHLYGEAGDDILEGDAGNDHLDGGAGTDTLRGGSGDDVYVIDGTSDGVEEGVGAGSDTVLARTSYTLADGQEIERLTGTANVELSLTGNAFANRIDGAGGNDTISGLDGDDQLFGNAGNDTIYGGAQDDIVRGDAGTDTLFGDAGADKLAGGAGSDILEGGDGNDTLDGGVASDTLRGGAGDDVYYVEGQIDTIEETAGAGSDVLVTTGSYTLSDSVAIEQLKANSDAGLTLTGNALDNVIIGRGGNDTLSGGAGADTIYAGAADDIVIGGDGRDMMRGEAGADRFVFNAVGDSAAGRFTADRIVDFNRAQGDLIDLSGIDAVTGGADNAFTVVSEFTQTAGQIKSTDIGGSYFVQGDVNGDGVADFGIIVGTDLPLTSADFIL